MEDLKNAETRIKKELIFLGIAPPKKHIEALALADQLKIFDDLHAIFDQLAPGHKFTYAEYLELIKRKYPVA